MNTKMVNRNDFEEAFEVTKQSLQLKVMAAGALIKMQKDLIFHKDLIDMDEWHRLHGRLMHCIKAKYMIAE